MHRANWVRRHAAWLRRCVSNILLHWRLVWGLVWRLGFALRIVIAGIWLAGAAITITLMLIILDAETPESFEVDFFMVAIIVLAIASPMIAAYKATKLILGRDD